MNEIDQKVVQMRFDNQQFESGVKQSRETIKGLKNDLHFEDTESRLEGLYRQSKLFSLSGIADGVEALARRFSTLGIVGMTVIQNLTTSAMRLGKKLLDFFVTPLVSGGEQRAEAIEQAKFQFEGLGMDIDKTMASALAAVKGTAYGLGDAALVASQFGASGMRAGKQMTKSLRAVAGVAAMTGRSYSDIGQIFTTVAGNGRLMGDQLLQLSSSGINAAAAIGKYLHKTEKQVRGMVSDGQISFKTFAAAMDSAFGKHAQDANKLFSGALANMRAALARIGADVQTAKLDNLRDILNALTPVIDQVHEKLKPLIDAFNDFQTSIAQLVVTKLNWFEKFNKQYKFLDVIIEGLKDNFITVQRILGAIGKAFRNVFPKASTYSLIKFAYGFRDLSKSLMALATPKVLEKIKTIFQGFFTVIKFGITVVTTFIKCIFGLAQGLLPIGKLLVNIASGFGQFLSGITQAITATNIFGGTVDSCNKLGQALNGLLSHMDKIIPFFAKLAQGLAKVFNGIFSGITDGLNGLNIDHFIKIMNGLLFGVVLKNLGDFINNLKFFRRKSMGLDGIIGVFDKLKTTLTMFQTQLKGEVLLKIAEAVGILAVSMVLLASIKPARLTSALVGLEGLFASLLGSMKFIDKIPDFGFKQVITLTNMMIALSTAILLLSTSMLILSRIKWSGIIKGLVSIGALCAMLIATAKFMSKKTAAGLARTSLAFVLFAEAIHILAKALVEIGNLSISQIAKGIAGIGALMAELVIFNKFLKKEFSVKTSASLILLGTALNIFAEAIKKMGELSVEQMAKGIAGIGIVLTELAIFMKKVKSPEKLVSMAFAMNLLGSALLIITKAVSTLGGMSLKDLGKGLGGLATALLIIGVAVKYMKTSLKGAAAMLIISAALNAMALALKLIGNMSIKQIAKSLITLAATLAIIGGATVLLEPVIPAMVGLGVALTLIAGACALAGVGLLAISAGITGLAVAFATGTVSITAGIMALVTLIPNIGKEIGLGLIECLKAITSSGEAIMESLTVIFSAILDAIIKVAPKIGQAVLTIIETILTVINQAVPRLVQTGFIVLMAFLNGIASNIGRVTATAIRIIVNFINAVADGLPKIIKAGWRLLLAFINGIADSVRDNNKKLIKAVGNLLDAFVTAAKEWLVAGIVGLKNIGHDIVQGIINGIKKRIDKIGSIAKTLGAALLNGIKKFLGIKSPSRKMMEVGKFSVMGLAKGLLKYAYLASRGSKHLGEKTLTPIREALKTAMELMNSDLDSSPKITPILDLSDVKKNVKELTKLSDHSNLSVGVALKKAVQIATRDDSLTETGATSNKASSISFVQNNYSPKALTRLEIYRQTKNQFSAAKGMVNS